MKRRNVIVEIVNTEQGTMAIWAFITKLIIGQERKWKCVQRKLDGRSVGKCLENWDTYRSMLLRNMNERTRIQFLLD